MSTKKMPGPDEALKNFFENNEVFADVFNSYLFKDDVIDPSELQPANTAYTDTVKTTKGVEKIGKYRDNIQNIQRYKADSDLYGCILHRRKGLGRSTVAT